MFQNKLFGHNMGNDDDNNEQDFDFEDYSMLETMQQFSQIKKEQAKAKESEKVEEVISEVTDEQIDEELSDVPLEEFSEAEDIDFVLFAEWVKNNEQQKFKLEQLAERRKHDVEMYYANGMFYSDSNLNFLDLMQRELNLDDFSFGINGENEWAFKTGYMIPSRKINGELMFWINHHFERKKETKYLNVFTDRFPNPKSIKVYGLSNLESAIELDKVFIVEGVFDAMLLNWYGIPTVALLGTEVTDYHKNFLKRFTNVIYINDNDKSGEFAWNKFKKICPQAERFTMLSGYKDPDELHKENNRLFKEWLSNLRKL